MQNAKKHSSHRRHSWKKIAKVTGRITLALAAFGIQGIVKCPQAHANQMGANPKPRKIRQEDFRDLASAPVIPSEDCEAARLAVLRQCTHLFSQSEQQALCFRAELPAAQADAQCSVQNKAVIADCHGAASGQLEFEALCVRTRLTPLRHASR